jgi:hypothetical protein
MNVLGIDPGTFKSAYVVFDGEEILDYGKIPNDDIFQVISDLDESSHVGIEQIKSYGMAVGAEVFETCWWSGRFYECTEMLLKTPHMIPRKEVCMHVCNDGRAKDANVRQAMLDRFGAPGNKKNPGTTYGIGKDVWSALAIACTIYDRWEAGNL